MSTSYRTGTKLATAKECAKQIKMYPMNTELRRALVYVLAASQRLTFEEADTSISQAIANEELTQAKIKKRVARIKSAAEIEAIYAAADETERRRLARFHPEAVKPGPDD